MASLRQTVKTLMPRPLLQRARAAAWSLGDIRYGLKTGQWGLPPAYLRVKVCGTIAPDDYIKSSRQTVGKLVDIVTQAGTDPAALTSVLDFGCGCGRLVAAFKAQLPQARFYGTDAEADLIEWPRSHIADAEFKVNSPEPPLPYTKGQFDFIYAVSVFTHLDERLQFLWLEELHRITKPGALLILTVLGSSDENKFEFVKNNAWSDFFPDHYQTTIHGQTYIAENWSRYFTILDYKVHAVGLQDAVVLRRP